MEIYIDLSNFTGPMDRIIENAKRIPKECAMEAARLVYNSMEINAPYDTGLLMSTIEIVEETGRYAIYPWVYYAPYPRYYGRVKGVIYQSTYAERALEGANPDMPDVISARAAEVLFE